jgi:hypothetical protein
MPQVYPGGLAPSDSSQWRADQRRANFFWALLVMVLIIAGVVSALSDGNAMGIGVGVVLLLLGFGIGYVQWQIVKSQEEEYVQGFIPPTQTG